jgi:hypothetical protein
MTRLRVKNWNEFQHYRDRRPPWIKLHHSLLDDFAWHRLPDASRALAPLLWLLASESANGVIPYDPETIAFRVHATRDKVAAAIAPLIGAGFLIEEQHGSRLPAASKQPAASESEKETQKEKERGVPTKVPEDFAAAARARGDRLSVRMGGPDGLWKLRLTGYRPGDPWKYEGDPPGGSNCKVPTKLISHWRAYLRELEAVR